MDDVGRGRHGCPPLHRRRRNSGGSRMPLAMTQPAHRQPCRRALTEPGWTPAPRRTRAPGQRRSQGGGRAGNARTRPGRAPRSPGRAGVVGAQRCRRPRPRADAAGQTGDGRGHPVGSTAKAVFVAKAGAHWVRQPPAGRREAPGRCSEVQGSPMGGDGEGCGTGVAGLDPAHHRGPRGWLGTLTARGPAMRVGSPRSLAWSLRGLAAAHWRRGGIAAQRRRGP